MEHIITSIISEANKCKERGTVAVFRICKAASRGIQLNDKHKMTPNPIFDALTYKNNNLVLRHPVMNVITRDLGQ